MTWQGHKIDICKQCGRKDIVSTRDLCSFCAAINMETAIEQMKAKKGAIYERWKKGIRRATGGTKES